MKKTKLFIGLISMCLLSSCHSNILNMIQIENVIFAEENIEMYVGEEKEIKYNILPENANNKAVQFIITNNKIIKFENNKIIALAKGESKLIIKSFNNKEDILLIKVKSKLDEINPFIEKIINSYLNEINNSIGGQVAVFENNKGKNITFNTYKNALKIQDGSMTNIYYKEDNKIYNYNKTNKEILGEIGTDFTEEESKEMISLFHYNNIYGMGNILLDVINNEFINLVTIKKENIKDETNNNLEKYTLGLEYMKDNIYYENNIVAVFMEDKLKSEAYSLYQYKENKKGAILSMTIFSSSIDYGERIDIDDTELSL